MAATITGRVTDVNDQVLPGATVTLIEATTHFERIQITDANGGYRFPHISPGNYDMKVHMPGFKENRKNGIEVYRGDTINGDFKLRPALS